MITKIISGGQTGADRAALDCAIAMGLDYGGWIPKGRLAEDGPISPEYSALTETSSSEYKERTRLNVESADGTLIVSHGRLTGGSLLTLNIAIACEKPCMHIDFEILGMSDAAAGVRSWIEKQRIGVINVAGARASGDPEIYRAAYDLLTLVLV